MKRITATTLLLCSLLAGCESDFDKCMNTELPRAEALAEVELEREIGRQLVGLVDLENALIEIDNRMINWIDENPPTNYPAFPEYTCGSYNTSSSWQECNSEHNKLSRELENEWIATPDAQLWIGLRDAEYGRLGLENGVSIANEEEFSGLFDEVNELYETVLEPRSSILQCYEDYKCDEYSPSNIEFDVVLKKALDQAIMDNTRVVSELEATANELATVTCNNNGFYE